MMKYRQVMIGFPGRLYSAGVLWHLAQKIVGKHANRALTCPVYLFHLLDWFYWFNLFNQRTGSAKASETYYCFWK